MATLRLSKHHGLGNDFLVLLDDDADPARLTGLADLAVSVCDRRRGIGADGLILVVRDAGSFRMHLRNSDGSTAELSGNGLRCLVQALGRARWCEDTAVIETDAGPRRALRTGGADDPTVQVAIEMGSATITDVSSAVADVLGSAKALAHVDVGNPHVVAVVDDPADHDPAMVGPGVERAYGTGVNVHLVAVADDGTVDMRIWERGAGVTEACGTGATAVAAALHGLGLVGTDVHVRMPGGAATVTVDDPLVLTGPATHIADIEITV